MVTSFYYVYDVLFQFCHSIDSPLTDITCMLIHLTVKCGPQNISSLIRYVCCVVLFCAVFCCVVSSRVVSYQVMSFDDILCHVMSFYVM